MDSLPKAWQIALVVFRPRLVDTRAWALNPHTILSTTTKYTLAKRLEADFLFPWKKLLLALW